MRNFSINFSFFEILVAGYIFSSLAFSGLPTWSMLSGMFAGLLILTIGYRVYNHRLRMGRWILSPLLFIVCCAIWSAFTFTSSHTAFLTTTTAWLGAIAVGLAMQNGVNIQVVIVPMIAAALANAIAIFFGFDAYIEYVADLARESEDVLLRRSTGLSGNPNAVAIQAILPLFLLVLWRLDVSRLIWVIALFCAIHALIVTGSRKGLYLAVVFVPYALYGLTTAPRATIVFLLSAICGLALSLFLIVSDISIFQNLLQDLEVVQRVIMALNGLDTSYLDRMNFIDTGIEAFLNSPLIGYGLDQYRRLFGGGLYSHNNYIEVAVSGGVLLFVAYYQIYLTAAWSIYIDSRLKRKARVLHGALLLVVLGLESGLVSYRDKFVVLTVVLLIVGPRLPVVTGKLYR